MVLDFGFGSANSSCNFNGHLKSDNSTVAVTGCLNKPGDKMHITILSKHNTVSSMYELDHKGNAKPLKNPMKKGMNDDDGKYLSNTCSPFSEETATVSTRAMTWPSEVYAYVKFGYDNTLKNQLAADGVSFNDWVNSVMTHVQAHYRHHTLPTKIQFKYDVSETIYKNANYPSTDYLKTWSQIGKDDGDKKVDLYVAFGKDSSYYGTVGLAWVGGACNDFIKTSFNEYRNSPSETAMVVAHEMGHNFGMSHDFDDKHGGDNGACNGQGIMSYGDAPSKWSSCSVSDFAGYYTNQQWGTKCLASWDAYCGDECPNCSLNPNTICQNPASFGGCNGRYQSYFKTYCAGTCGFC